MSEAKLQTAETKTKEQVIADSFSQAYGQKVKIVFTKKNRLKVSLDRADLIEVARYARDNLNFDHCTNNTGTDFPKEKLIEITYHFGSIEEEGLRPIILALSCRIPSDDPTLPSLISLFPSADYHERETAEMIGAVFNGNPNLGRFMLPEDWSDIPPMLKAYRLPGRLEAE